MTYSELSKRIFEKGTFLCVGLDPDQGKMPEKYRDTGKGIFEFNKAIIDSTAEYCVAFKPNLAFYESLGAEGYQAFEDTVRYIKTQYPDQLVIADAKRGDIGNTARQYAEAFFNVTGADAVTVAPYMGKDSVMPFLGFEQKWAVVLALTSNPGSADFQKLTIAGNNLPLYINVLKESSQWGSKNDMMYVVGATQAEMFEGIREVVPEHFLLVPGVGAQGGSLEDVAHKGLNANCGLLINSSRGIIHVSKDDDFADRAREAAKELAEKMRKLLDEYLEKNS